jgi:PilZ domain-containing protein
MEQRRTRRFKLQLPLAITRAGAERVTLPGFTKNISSSGVLFTSEREPDLGSPIEYIITLNHDGSQAVSLRCMGKVLRSELIREPIEEHPPAYQIAATLERYEFVRDR